MHIIITILDGLLDVQLLGLLGSLKGITTDSVASQCVLKLCEGGELEMINKSNPQQFQQFSAHFISNTDQAQACNFASFVPSSEILPLQVREFTSDDACLYFLFLLISTIQFLHFLFGCN